MIQNYVMHVRYSNNHWCFFAILILFFFLPAQGGSAETTPTPPDSTNEQKLTLIEVYTWSNTLPKDLIDLQDDIQKLVDINSIQEQLPDISRQAQELEWQATALKSNPNLTFHEITQFESKLIKLNFKIDKINTPITTNIDTLEGWYKEWIIKEKKFKDIVGEAEGEFELDNTLPDFYSLAEIVSTGKNLIEEQLRPTLLAGQEVGKIQTQVYSLSVTTSDLIKEMSLTGTQQTSPSMFSAEFYKLVNKKLFVKGWENIRLFGKYQWRYLGENIHLVVISLIVILVLALFVHLSNQLIYPSSGRRIFASKPVITAIFIACATFSIVNTSRININLPPDWDTLVNLPLLFAVGILAKNICKTPWQTTLARHLLFFVGLTLLLTLFSLPQILFYLFVFYASVGLLVYYLFQFVKRWSKPATRKVTWAILIWGIFPIVIIVAGVSGFDQLAVLLFGRVLSLIAATITIRLILLFISGFLELLLNNAPWQFIRKNATTIVEQIYPLLALLHFILWVAVILTITWVYPTLNAAFAAMTSLKFTFFSTIVTPGSVLTIILIIYLTFLISRAIQAFLRQEVLPHHGVDKGVQISITRLVHYAVLTIGFIVLLRILGFGLNQITILGGALGVGIGFGLQAIVNNFVSGLILLFERPIKVGDIIDVGDQIGEVKELGLRATTVQTFDNAEIVIPNSQLITDSLTNWTLAEKKTRIKVPVGVAYGTDITEVLKILLACAEANPMVLSTPKPTALFLSFGNSSLDFELRVWIADFNERLTVLSELNQDIEAEFETADIEIPFPQTDLHLRSVDQDALSSLYELKKTDSIDKSEV